MLILLKAGELESGQSSLTAGKFGNFDRRTGVQPPKLVANGSQSKLYASLCEKNKREMSPAIGRKNLF